jgi:hypothetical protein
MGPEQIQDLLLAVLGFPQRVQLLLAQGTDRGLNFRHLSIRHQTSLSKSSFRSHSCRGLAFRKRQPPVHFSKVADHAVTLEQGDGD